MPWLSYFNELGAVADKIDVGGQGAMTLGILNASLLPVSFRYLRGNCTFPPYRSSAY